MRRNKIAVSCALVAVALSATAAGTASAALPEFTGPFPKSFQTTTSTITFMTSAKQIVRCGAAEGKGKVVTGQTFTLNFTFQKCGFRGQPCKGIGTEPGTVTTALTGKLGYVSASTKLVGVDLEAPAAGPFVLFECESNTFLVKGSVIGKIKPVNKKVLVGHFLQIVMARAGSKQRITHLEGEPNDVLETSLNAGAFQETGLSAVSRAEFEEVVEVQA